jgi:hypothetical protein
VAAVDECFGQVDLAALVQVSRNRSEDAIEYPFAFPFLETAMASGVRRIPRRKVCPRSAGPQDPENSVQNVTRVPPRPATLLRRPLPLRPRNQFLDRRPLLVGEVHLQPTNISPPTWKASPKRWSNFDHLPLGRVMRCALATPESFESPRPPPEAQPALADALRRAAEAGAFDVARGTRGARLERRWVPLLTGGTDKLSMRTSGSLSAHRGL